VLFRSPSQWNSTDCQPQSQFSQYTSIHWEGKWLSGKQYYANAYVSDFVEYSGDELGYICLVSHISGTFATDLAAGKWGAADGKVGVYDPTKRTTLSGPKNDCYIYLVGSWEKPLWETGLQAILDRLKTAGTVAIINPK
jgi:hypothetical protein